MRDRKTVTVIDGLTYFNPSITDEILIPKFVRHVRLEFGDPVISFDDLRKLLLTRQIKRNKIRISGYNINNNEIIKLYIEGTSNFCSGYYDSETKTMIFKNCS